MAACLFQLDGQIGQFPGVGGVVTDHVLHQRQQLLHGGVLAGGSTAVAVMAAFVAVIVGMTLAMQMVVGVGMVVVMFVAVGMLMGVSNTVVGVLVSVGMFMVVAVAADVIVMNMHNEISLRVFSFIILAGAFDVKTFIFAPYPPYGLAKQRRMGYNVAQREEVCNMEDEKLHTHDHAWQHAHGVAHSHGHVHENQKAVVNRLARAIGHLEKVKRMVEEGYDCSEVLVQLAAVRSAIDNTGKVILQDHMRHCMVDAVAAGDEAAIEDLCHAIERYMK